MKIDLSCEIVRDLLPTYIDGLASPGTEESVTAHLKQCEGCQNVYKRMKEENKGDSNDMRLNGMGVNDTRTLEAEKTLFKKINRKVNKKARMAAIAGIIGVIGAVGVMQLVFNTAFKDVPVSEVTVSATVYPLGELVTEENQGASDETVKISKGDSKNEEAYYSVSIPDMPSGGIVVSKDMVDSGEYVSYIAWESPYLLKDIKWDVETVNHEQVMYVKGFKTTLLNNKVSSNSAAIVPMIEFQKIDKIVYVGEDDTQDILWQNTTK